MDQKRMNILFIDACPRAESRTRRLAEAVLGSIEGDVTTVKLSEAELPDIDEAAVNARIRDVETGCFNGPDYAYAKQFAQADCIVIAAPFWDMSFPAILKKYIEAITVTGITFRYSEQGIPIGLCRAEKLYYVTTAGGPIFNEEFGYGYIRTMAQGMYGIRDCRCYRAENLDINGVDAEEVLQSAIGQVTKDFQRVSRI